MSLIAPEFFLAFLTACALVYSIASVLIQRTIGDYKRVKGIQDNMNKLNKDLSEAMKTKDAAKIESAQKKQLESMGDLNTLMMLQMKPLIVILIIFSGTIFLLNSLDPYTADDLKIPMLDNGNAANCDKIAGDGIYSACYSFNNSNFGAWAFAGSVNRYAPAFDMLGIQLMPGIRETGLNTTELYYQGGKKWDVKIHTSGEPVLITTDSASNTFVRGEKSGLYAKINSPVNESRGEFVLAKLDSGTSFFVDLPFTIPIINVQRVTDVYGWFLLCVFIFGMVVSLSIQKLMG